MRLLVAAHDAGGAELLAAWLARERHDVAFLLDGPARAVFARRLGPVDVLEALPDVRAFELVVCGSSVASALEQRVVRAARGAGVRCAVWLDHWVNYPARFVLDGTTVLPDELWVADVHAERLARATVPGPPVYVRGNPYLEDAAGEVRALERPHVGAERILYVTEPTSVAAERATGDPLGWGYEERAALRGYLQACRPPGVRLRTHPSEPADKYAEFGLERSAGRTLAEDIAWADTVVGCDTMAMAVALASGRRVISVIPPGGRPLSLPYAGIERMFMASSVPMSDQGEVGRLEALWREGFGDEYIERNRAASEGREPFWRELLERHPFRTALEVGCNLGGNLRWLAELVDPKGVYGVDINAQALREVRSTLPDVNAVLSPARSLPFRDGMFDLTFTTTVLIHQPVDALPIVMNEVVRCSRRYVLCGEYFSEQLEEIHYRGHDGALFKRDWGALYQRLFPELKLLDQRFEPLAEDGTGWDDVTFWLFERT